MSFRFSYRYFATFVLTLCVCVTTLTGCSHEPTFEEFTKELFLEEVSSNTITLHYSLEEPSSFGLKNYELSLGDYSLEAQANLSSSLSQLREELLGFSYYSLSTEEQLTYDILLDFLDTQIALSAFSFYEEPLSFSGGVQLNLPILLAEYEFQDEQDVKEYLKLLAMVDEVFLQIVEFEKEKSAAGLFMSEDLCEKTILSCESFLEETTSHYLVRTFENRLSKLGLSSTKAAKYLQENLDILTDQLFPAYRSLILELSQLQSTGTNPLGICHFKNGRQYYELLTYAQTGCRDSIDELYRRIDIQRMQDLIQCSSLCTDDPTLLSQCAFLEWEMEDETAILEALQGVMLDAFPAPPDTTCEISYVDPSLEEYLAPAFYIVAPLDAYLENTIYLNDSYVTNDLYGFTTLAHEGYPGHLYQTVMSYEYGLPELRTILNYPGYVEGWATYIEMMAFSYAGLPENVASFLSSNQAATLSLYATSDIGLHYYGWTKEDMYEFWYGYGISNEEMINEITQLILAEPGNYLKYYIGYLEFLDLKETAQKMFASDYSDMSFHQAVLDIGPAPFAILEKYLESYYPVS